MEIDLPESQIWPAWPSQGQYASSSALAQYDDLRFSDEEEEQGQHHVPPSQISDEEGDAIPTVEESNASIAPSAADLGAEAGEPRTPLPSQNALAHRARLAQQRATVQQAIQSAVTSFLDDLGQLRIDAALASHEPSPHVHTPSQGPCTRPRVARFSLTRSARSDDASTSRTQLFPSRSSTSTRRLAQLLRVLEEMSCALLTNQLVTKRDVYYRCPSLFGKQAVVDRIVDSVVARLGVRRSATGIVAAPKGLLAGCGTLSLTPTPGQDAAAAILEPQASLHLSPARATSVPDVDVLEGIETQAQWILVVEKEAVFRTLLECRFADSATSKGIIMTGRGYPDLASRDFLTRLCEEKPGLPIFTLVDADPYGMDISELYRRSLPSAVSLQLVGISMADVSSLELPTQSLSPADRKKANDMLSAANEMPSRIKLQLTQMLAQGIKAEIEAVEIAARRRRERAMEDGTARQEALVGLVGLVDYLRERLP